MKKLLLNISKAFFHLSRWAVKISIQAKAKHDTLGTDDEKEKQRKGALLIHWQELAHSEGMNLFVVEGLPIIANHARHSKRKYMHNKKNNQLEDWHDR